MQGVWNSRFRLALQCDVCILQIRVGLNIVRKFSPAQTSLGRVISAHMNIFQ